MSAIVMDATAIADMLRRAGCKPIHREVGSRWLWQTPWDSAPMSTREIVAVVTAMDVEAQWREMEGK